MNLFQLPLLVFLIVALPLMSACSTTSSSSGARSLDAKALSGLTADAKAGRERIKQDALLAQVSSNGSLTVDSSTAQLLAKAASSKREMYRIGVDDQIQITVRGNPDLDVTVPVRPDGKISMPLVGDILVGGRTPKEVSKIISNYLAKYVRNPSATVIMTQLRSHEYLRRVRITGAVTSPSSMPYRGGMTVLDAVLASGGVNEFAAPNKTKLYRKIDGVQHVSEIHLDDILKKGEMASNIALAPGDIVTIPERLF
ncbi:MAG: polysaccharide biosynthesis/export family protein [Gammaproteobacteria bacterium]|nr:polysaccharide biosynthesis/export family protein [Gammaproteobacteria bacterium]